MKAVPWQAVVRWALLGCAITIVLVAVDVDRTGVSLLNLVQPGKDGPAHQAFEEDFPGAYLPDGIGHDGSQFYAIARQPFSPHDAERDLGGNPRYRYQRIVYPVLSWVLHPTGGGTGLITSMVLIGVLAVMLGGVAMGGLVTSLGGPAWSAAVYGVVPGVYAALRISVADNVAMALVLLAMLLSLRSRHGWAVAAAVVAVLTREVSIVPLVGFAIWRRDRNGAILVAVPAAVFAVWYLTLAQIFSGVGIADGRTGFLEGFRAAWPRWTGEEWPTSLLVVVGSYVLVGAVVVLRRRSPVFWAVVVSAVLTLFIHVSAITYFFNITRTYLPLMVLCLVALLGRNEDRARSPARQSRFRIAR